MQVNKVIYILLALFLGSFGIHKFYAGKNMHCLSGLLLRLFNVVHYLLRSNERLANFSFISFERLFKTE